VAVVRGSLAHEGNYAPYCDSSQAHAQSLELATLDRATPVCARSARGGRHDAAPSGADALVMVLGVEDTRQFLRDERCRALGNDHMNSPENRPARVIFIHGGRTEVRGETAGE
jgi:hypothetical protein